VGVNIINIIHAETNESVILALVIFTIFFVKFLFLIYIKLLCVSIIPIVSYVSKGNLYVLKSITAWSFSEAWSSAK